MKLMINDGTNYICGAEECKPDDAERVLTGDQVRFYDEVRGILWKEVPFLISELNLVPGTLQIDWDRLENSCLHDLVEFVLPKSERVPSEMPIDFNRLRNSGKIMVGNRGEVK